jgi:apolipoprotein N-acyltransferase
MTEAMPGRFIAGLALSALSAVLLIVSWQSWGNLWWFTFVAFVPMYVAQYRFLPRRWSAIPVAMAFAAHYFAVAMLSASVLPMPIIVATTAASAVIGLIIGIFLRPFAERTGYRWFVVQFGLIWVVIDLLVQNNEIIGTYMWMAYRLADAPRLIAPVSITGTPALTLLLHVINASIALVFLALIDRRRPGLAEVPVPRRVLAFSLGLPVAVSILWVSVSMVLYAAVSNRMGPAVRVATVQPGLTNASPGTLISAGDMASGRSEQQRRTDQIAELSDMTRQAADRGARVVVWPEETLDYDPRITNTDWIPALLRQTGVYLAMGFTPNSRDGSAPNTGLLWDPQGRVEIVYLKTKRVLAEGESFTPGSVYPTMQTPVGTLGMIICFDIDFPDGPARRTVQGGAQMILAPSIDVESISSVRSASTVFRAVENRVAMVKADTSWDSVIVAPNGQVPASDNIHTQLGGQALLVADVPLGPRGAPFTRYGGLPFQWLAYALTAVMVGVMVASWRRSR